MAAYINKDVAIKYKPATAQTQRSGAPLIDNRAEVVVQKKFQLMADAAENRTLSQLTDAIQDIHHLKL